ncbi:hypothetical protein [Streptantibioticus cattleyicolor]|uniref:Uncharacterized protein n=1 Tax=Streptantibioticus cattleyicolor (strain ATCC 35852 / DSM 46488 / JCM 4925 / NBRC 14057 / NRRL 8057) TaxID=1003195 RepID=F8JMD1_STREN|nr:hypothetical protein [Streptantibioticus cattleyicolor]AEW99167.1 hypothetical protein SCATT_p09740 [Streptantibioticus cattleyicolor NRRL 8057 = DSM 46488]CCB71790.1 protein of unknown function [Streptantibioticus cattleyicolor NRRL 8057 = DSM 46488]
MTQQDPTGLAALTDDELRTHVRIMLEGRSRRGPAEWALTGLDDEVYEEIERRVPACAALRRRQDELLHADLERRRRHDPTTPQVSDYADNGHPWADPDAERAYVRARDEWRRLMAGWLDASG